MWSCDVLGMVEGDNSDKSVLLQIAVAVFDTER